MPAWLRRSLLRGLAPVLLLAVCWPAVQSRAATTELAELLRPAGVRDVQISPSGSRVAALVQGSQSDSNLLVLEERAGKLSTLLTTRLDTASAVAGFRWLSDDYLAVYYASADQEFAQFGIVDIPHHAIRVQDPFVGILKAPWGDDSHILLSETGAMNCTSHVAARCLVTMDIRSNTSERASDPLPGPVAFLAVSPDEIYASTRDARGQMHDFRLNASTREWKPVSDGTMQHRQDELGDAPMPPEVQRQQASAQMPGSVPVWTVPDHHLVGLEGLAPQRAFLALDSHLDGVEALLEQTFAGDRAHITSLNSAFTRGMVTISGADQPPLYLFFTDAGTLTKYSQLDSSLAADTLGRTHIEHGWVADMPVAVTMPPQGVAPTGAVVEPVIGTVPGSEEPLVDYDGFVQALAQTGMVVVRPLIVIPAAFADMAAGAAWRQTQVERLRTVLGRVRSDLVPQKSACLYGEDLAATLALEWSTALQVDCTVAVGARLDPGGYMQPITIVVSRAPRVVIHGGGRNRMVSPAPPGQVTVRATNQQLHRDFPALFGAADSAQPLDPAQWAGQLHGSVLLAYDMQLRLQQEFATESGEFRKATARAGKPLTFYTDESVAIDDIQSRDRMLQAVIDYLHAHLSAAPQ